MLNPETLPKDKTRKEFLRFVEDFNTGSQSIDFLDTPTTDEYGSDVTAREVLPH